MSYPNALDTDTTPGASIYPPQATQSPGALTSAPAGTANPTLSQWMQRTADSLVGVETQLGLPSSPAAGSVLNTLATKVSEAPTDGKAYARQSSAWAAAPAEAPTDGNIYARQNGTWVLVQHITYSHSAPSGGNPGDLWFQY